MFGALRLRHVIPRIRGRLLDVGCGTNALVQAYGGGRGVQRIEEASEDAPYDTITLVAVLNYIPHDERQVVVTQCYHRLVPCGRLLVTCITPVGSLLHKSLRPRQPWGCSPRAVREVIESCGFRLVYRKAFMGGLNQFYVFGKHPSVLPTLAVAAYRKEIEAVKAQAHVQIRSNQSS